MKTHTITLFQRRLAGLKRRKSDVEFKISRELRKRMPCEFSLRQLKKLRLFLKDEIEELRRRAWRNAAQVVPA